MPKGLIIMRYDNKSGISIKAKYPGEGLDVSDGTLMNIFSLHEFSKQDGIVSLTVGEINIATYYTGEDLDYYVVLILKLLENPEDYEERLKEISQIILENLEEEKYIDMLPSLFTQVSKLL
ncbi:MAG: hypothetical protein KGD65_04745 [Candidatus Lokiarchaeota archaeon]|nr:hypothetical protein [Candidatus Lokiarchaeota archaeon]